MPISGAEIVCESLLREGVDVAFSMIGATGGMLLDALSRYPQLHCVMFQHGQDAGHAADGYARATGKVGVCLGASGPETTNMVTGIASAFLDSSPLVVITSQVASHTLGSDAFNEMDITAITMPVTKHNYLVLRADSLAAVLKEAFHLARTGRPGPVLVDVPADVLRRAAEFHYPKKINLPGYKPTSHGHIMMIKKAAKLINKASKPLVIAGHGVMISGTCDELRKLSEIGQIPVATTLLGIGSFPETHALSLGMLGVIRQR